MINMQAMETQAYIANDSATHQGDYLHQATNTTTIYDVNSTLEMWQAALICCLGLLIITTVVGNIMILIAIAYYKPLRVPQNYLIASLATSDLLVGVVVMPISLIAEVSVGWIFSHVVCNFWISMDVLYCTASILNLTFISLDRYWAITEPVKYSTRRTTKRMLIYIIAVWLLSMLISIVPLFGWESNSNLQHSDCVISQNIYYTIFSTFGAFFIPATIIMVVYFRISVEARRRIRKNVSRPPIPMLLLNKPCSSTAETKLPHSSQSSPNLSSQSQALVGTSSETQRPPDGKQDLNSNNPNAVKYLNGKAKNKSTANQHKSELLQHPTESKRLQDEQPYVKNTTLKNDSLQDKCIIAKKSRHNSSPSCKPSSPPSRGSLSPCSRGSFTFSLKGGSFSSRGSVSSSQTKGSLTSLAIEERLREKRALAAAREQRATRTVFIVTGSFLICWLPFFLAAIILPLCDSCYLPQVYKSIFLWLGYLNSMLDPIIYTVFNKDFKNAFKKMLCWGCRKHISKGQVIVTRTRRLSSYY